MKLFDPKDPSLVLIVSRNDSVMWYHVLSIDFVNREVEVLPEEQLEGGNTASWKFDDIEFTTLSY